MTKAEVKHIRSLAQKKYRKLYRQFIAEGPKIVADLLASDVKIIKIYALAEWIKNNNPKVVCEEISEAELKKISQLTTPNQVLAVVEIPERTFSPAFAKQELIIALDNIRDPGNLGTIIRIADWFGYRKVLCSYNCVDAYNPKAIQASMGSVARVQVYYEDLEKVFSETYPTCNIYGAFLTGKNLYSEVLESQGFLVIGNESTGISPQIARYVKKQLLIPTGITQGAHADSLNASVATAIFCSEFFRRKHNY